MPTIAGTSRQLCAWSFRVVQPLVLVEGIFKKQPTALAGAQIAADCVGLRRSSSSLSPLQPTSGFRKSKGLPCLPSTLKVALRTMAVTSGESQEKPVVLVNAKNMVPLAYKRLEQEFKVLKLWEAQDKEAWLQEHGPCVRAVATAYNVGAKEELIATLPNLEVISVYGVGVDATDVKFAKEKGIAVANTPGVLTADTADTALTLLLATARKTALGDKFVRAGHWKSGDLPLATSISVGNKKAGILGLGDIGKAVAKRLEAFGVEILYSGPRRKPEVAYKYYSDLTEMAQDCNFLILTCPGGPATYHVVNKEVLEALGPQGILVNVARGTVVEEEALVAALTDGKLGAAGLDVFESEPNVPEPLLSMDNVVLLPHVGSATTETRNAMADLMIDNLTAHFAGKPLLTPVS